MTDGPKDTASSRGSDLVNPAEVAAMLRRLLASVEGGEIAGTATMIARLEGAALALESLPAAPRPAPVAQQHPPSTERGWLEGEGDSGLGAPGT